MLNFSTAAETVLSTSAHSSLFPNNCATGSVTAEFTAAFTAGSARNAACTSGATFSRSPTNAASANAPAASENDFTTPGVVQKSMTAVSTTLNSPCWTVGLVTTSTTRVPNCSPRNSPNGPTNRRATALATLSRIAS